MSSGSIPRVYWDTSLFISALTNSDPTKTVVVRQCMQLLGVSQPAMHVILSNYLRAELRVYPNDDPAMQQVIQRLILSVGASEAVYFYSVTRLIADLAAQLGSQHTSLSPPDAVHVATALFAGADRFWTYDGARRPGARRSGSLIRLSGQFGDLIIEPPNPAVIS